MNKLKLISNSVSLGDFMKKICKFLITGGQLAGKDTIILRLKKELEDNGYYVIYTNEIAEYIMRHNIRPFGEEKIDVLKLQDAVFKTQLFTEDLYLSLAENIQTNKPIVFLVNRGLLDGKAFLEDEQFETILKNNHYDVHDVTNRYDIVFCLETMAKLGVYNQQDNNEVRFQNQNEAVDMNDKFFNDYLKYFPKTKYFKASSSFEDKYQAILKEAKDEISKFFNEKIQSRIRKKQ